MAVETILLVGTVGSLIGAGVSSYSQYQQGKTQNAIAQFNAAQQEKQVRLQMAAMGAQAAIQKQQAEATFAMQSAQAQAQFNNAKSLENQAIGEDNIFRSAQRDRQQELAAAAAKQRAQIAASGAIEASGTPLDLLAETAGLIQRDAEAQKYQQDINLTRIYREADMQRLGGQLALAGATLDRSSGLAEAGLTEASGRAQYLSGLREAEITRLTGKHARQMGMYGAAGTLFSGMGDAAGGYARYKLG